jgi:hypothetical protein
LRFFSFRVRQTAITAARCTHDNEFRVFSLMPENVGKLAEIRLEETDTKTGTTKSRASGKNSDATAIAICHGPKADCQ